MNRFYTIKRYIALFLLVVFLNFSLCPVVLAADIQIGGPLPTDTNMVTSGNTTNIFTNTTVNGGQTGINSFNKFNVYEGDIVNLNLINGQNKLVNLIYDSSASQINGVVNSYMNGVIGGNVLFANPNGFVIGKTGVFNVGALTLMTPTVDAMKNLIDGNTYNETNVNGLLTFSFDGNDYFVGGNNDFKYELAPSSINIDGTINSNSGIDLIAGNEIELGSDSVLNANVNKATASVVPNTIITGTTTSYNSAMQDGNGIVIVAQNKGDNRDILSAIVNLNGKIDANGGDVIAQTEIYKADKTENVSVSKLTVKENADITGHDVYLKAKSKITSTDDNVFGLDEDNSWLSWLGPEELNYIISNNFVHLADIKTQVLIDSGAKLNATNNLNINSYASLPISATTVMETLAFNYTDLDILTEAIINSGADITAKNLEVRATTDLRLSTSSKATNLLERVLDMFGKNIFGHGGAYAFNINLIDVANRAVINKDVVLNVSDNISVVASTLSNHDDVTKVGLIPIVDWNLGTVGSAISVIVRDVTNEAIMNADTNINGELNVVADYSGYIRSVVYGWSTATGEDGTYGAVGRFVQSIFNKIKGPMSITTNDIIARGTANFDDIHVGAAIGVAIDDVVNTAKIGSIDDGIKPNISASNVSLGAILKDNESTLYTSTETDNGQTSISGAVAVNIKDLSSTANAYGDFTLLGGSNGNALIVLSDTQVNHPMGVVRWIKDFINAFSNNFNVGINNENVEKEAIKDVNTGNASDYIAEIGDTETIQDAIDSQGSFGNIMNVIDFNNPVLNGFFNTFASSQANATAKEGKTNAYAGAVATAVFNTSSQAQLLDGSSVNLTGTDVTKNNIIIQAKSNNEMWSGAGIISVLNATKLLAGATARDGDSLGGGISFQYSDSDTIARIGENVTIKAQGNGQVGDLYVEALEDGNYVNLAIGSGAADESGLAGGIAVTVLAGGETKAKIETSNEENAINAKELNVKAEKDDNFINSVIAYANSQNSKGFGISGIVLYDAVESYIAGNVNTTGNIWVDAIYDKLFVNSVLNVGIAKEGSDAPIGKVCEPEDADDYLALSMEALFAEDVSSKTEALINQANVGYDFTRATNPDKQTSANAGSITSNVAVNDVKAYIADEAKANTGGSLTVNAQSKDNMYNASAVIAANGKSGAGASITADFTKNNVESYIGQNTNITANSDVSVKASEKFNLIAGSVGIAQAKDDTGVGNVSIDVQVNDVSAAIKKGANVEANKTTTTDGVTVTASMDTNVIKGIGSVAIQSGGNNPQGGAKGATLDGDVAINNITAYIDDATVKTNSDLNVKATNTTNVVMVDAAGAISTQNGAYDGTIGAFVSVSEENAYIKDSDINAKNLKVKSKNTFDEVVIVGTAAGGKQTAAGGSVRTDIIADKTNSYIKDSDVNSNKLDLENTSNINSISVAVAGAVSTNLNATSGAVMIIADCSEQNNYIDNSDITVNKLTLYSDKILDTIGVTGALAVAAQGTSIGGSVYTAIANHVMNTYIKNSDVKSTGDISLTSEYTEDVLSIIFGGGGGQNVAVTGAISTLVNNSETNTYVLAEATSAKKKLYSTNGQIKLKSKTDIDTITVDGNVGISTNAVAAGGAVNTTVYDSEISAGIKGADVIAKNGIDILAKGEQNHISVVVGASGGKTGSVEGSVDSLVMMQDIDAYIKDSVVKSDSDITVKTEDDLTLVSTAGAVAATTYVGASVGGAMLTVDIKGEDKAHIDNTTFDKYSNNAQLGKLLVKATQTDDTRGATVSGTYGTLSVAGTIDTIVIDKTVKAYTDGLENINDSGFANAEINAYGKTYLGHGAGQLSASSDGIGVGGAVNTQVITKNIKSEILNSTLNSRGYLKNLTSTDIDIISFALGFGASGEMAVNGSVITQVLNIDTKSLISKSILSSSGDLVNDSFNDIDLDMYVANANGSKVSALGGSVYSLVDNSKAEAFIENNSDIINVNKLQNTSKVDTNYLVTLVNAAASGELSANGMVSTFVLNTESNTKIEDSKLQNSKSVEIKSDNISEENVIVAQATASGSVAANGAINTVVANKKSKVDVKKSTLQSAGNILIDSNANNTLESTVAGGAFSGTAAFTGTVNTIVSKDEVHSTVEDSSITTVLSSSNNEYGITVKSNDNMNVVGRTGNIGASGTVAAGGSIVTGVINNSVKSNVKNSELSALNSNINLIANAKEIVGSSSNPFITIAANGSGTTAISGAVDTLVLNSESIATIEGDKTKNIINAKNLDLSAQGDTDLFLAVGTGAGSGVASVGGTVNTVVLDKNIDAIVDGATVTTNSINIDASATDYISEYTMGGVGAGVAGVSGIVSTTVASSVLNSGIKNSIIKSDDVDISSEADVTYEEAMGNLALGGVAGVGATVLTNVTGYTSNAYVQNSKIYAKNGTDRFESLDIASEVDSTYNIGAVSGAAAGVAAVCGVVETNSIQNTVNAYISGTNTDIYGKNLNVNSSDILNITGIGGGMAVGLATGVGATLQTNLISSDVTAYIGGKINVENINVSSDAEQNFVDMYVLGLGGGIVGINGSSLANVVEATVKSYVAENAIVTAGNKLELIANNETNFDMTVGSVSGGLVGVGAAVAVNKIRNKVAAYTDKNVSLNTKTTNIEAQSINNIGKSDDKIIVVAGSAGTVAVAGAVVVNDIADTVKAYIDTTTNNINISDKLDIKAQADTNIYEDVGGAGFGLVGIGASVGINNINNTVNSYIASNVTGNADINVVALSNDIIDALGVIVSGGKYALSGGVIYNSIGQNVNNAVNNILTDANDRELYSTANSQSEEVLSVANNNKTTADSDFLSNYSKAVADTDSAISDTNNSVETSLRTGLNSSVDINSSGNSDDETIIADSDAKTNLTSVISNKESGFTLFKQPTTTSTTNRDKTTSAFIDSGVSIAAKNFTVNAKNTNDVDIDVNSASLGGASVGASIGISNVDTTTNAFISNDVIINANGKLEVKAESVDNQDVIARAASGGIFAGSGSFSNINSNKTTNSYILDRVKLYSKDNLSIITDSLGTINATTTSISGGALTIGISSAEANITGSTKIDIGENVLLNSTEGNITISANTKETATADATAGTGSLAGGTGAEAVAQAGKDSRVNIKKNLNLISKLKTSILSIAENNATARSNGRAYGGISVGSTTSDANVINEVGVTLSDADNNTSNIKASEIEISSKADNNVNSSTNAGAGALLGASDSYANTTINSNNNIVIGKNYSVETTDGAYDVTANTADTYKSFNDSSAYGAIGETAGTITNTINSTVKAESDANIISAGVIGIAAINNVKKAASLNYDLYGGAGGLVGVGSAVLEDNITMTTSAILGGDKAYANGNNNNGHINIASQSILNVNEKVNVDAGGGIPVSDGDAIVTSKINTTTKISNKDIKTKDDDIYYLADNDINIYTKANIESYGGVAVADGESTAKNNNSIAQVLINSGVNSLSGRDTMIQAATNKNIQAYIYATTAGLIGAVGGSEANAYNDSTVKVDIENNAKVQSYDSMTISAFDSIKNLIAKRTAKGTTYIVFGIPITIYGKGNEYKTNNSNSTITLNGTVESGLGAKRSLTINNDGSYSSDGIEVIGKEEVGQVTSGDIDSDIQIYETQKAEAIAEIDRYIETQQQTKDNAQTAYNSAKTQSENLTQTNQNLDNSVTQKKAEITSNDNNIQNLDSRITNIDNIKTAYSDATTTEGGTTTISDSFGTVLQNYTDSSFNDVKTAWANYSSDKTSDNLTNLQNSINALDSLRAQANTEKTSLEYANRALNAEIDDLNLQISRNKDSITTAENTMTTQNSIITKAQAEIDNATAEKTEITANFDSQIDALEIQKTQAEQDAIKIYSMKLADVEVRSGDMNINGSVSGSGTIITPGNNFSIEIVNNSVNDVLYNNLVIASNVSGKLNVSNSLPSSINNIVRNAAATSKISVLNTVDANDPTINLSNGFGDMVFTGNIENITGDIELTNYTGNVLSSGSILSKNLKITVPNGNYNQAYTDDMFNIGGTSANGGIVASGDIDIAARTINVNGLIQSGSDIKEINIPAFNVIKKADGKYYQVVNGVETEMLQGTTEGYYYLSFADNSDITSDLKAIKAYFKPSASEDLNNIQGDIYLFKAEIQGGNITLTGNIVSNSNNGKIVLVNGYGYIDINNNSNYNLVTSALNADSKINGKLTINDFKLSAGNDSSFDNITQDSLTDSFLTQHAGKYTASVDDAGNIVTSAENKTSGNGAWGSTSTTQVNGENINSITYTPGSDAYVVSKAGSVETKSYQVYVKRSWWTELWYGKLYKTVYYNVIHDPEYVVAKNNINVQFKGFDTPQININSVGSVIMNNTISAINGDVNITSSANLSTNNINNLIHAQSVILNAAEIGNSLKPIQTAIYNNGVLSATGNNVYLNYPNTDIRNIIVNAVNTAVLSTNESIVNTSNSIISINADSLELKALNGSIDLDVTSNENNIVNINKLKAKANGDITLANKGDLTISSITSEGKGTVNLSSKNGSVLVTQPETYSPYHIDAGNVIINAVNGAVGTVDNKILIANDGIYKIKANDDIYLKSVGRIYTDLISSAEGSVNLDADYGIIASNSSESLVYNIYSASGVKLNTTSGNIENLNINTDGVINASAGYQNGTPSGMSDISINLISKQGLTTDELSSLQTEEDFNNYVAPLKDLKIGEIKASQNIYLTSEKSILNASNTSSVQGEKILLSATNGNIGTSESMVKLDALRDITAYAGKDKGVYLTSNGDLNINEIASFKTLDSNTGNTVLYTLANVVLDTVGNIFNTGLKSDSVNIAANNVSLNAGSNIGSLVNEFIIDTNSTNSAEGLSYSAQNAYIKGVNNNLNILSASVGNDSEISTADNISLTINNVVVGNSLIINSGKDSVLTGNIEATSITVNSDNTSNINNATITGNITNESNSLIVDNATLNNDFDSTSTTANIVNMVVADDTNISTTDKTTIANATIGGSFTNSSNDTEVTGKLTVVGDSIITANNSIKINEAELKNLTSNSATANIVNMVVAEDTNITTTDKTTLANATVNGSFTNNSKDMEVTGRLTVAGDSTITANNSIKINEAELKNLTSNSATANIVNMVVAEDTNITTTDKTTLANATVNGSFTNNSKDMEVTGRLTVAGDTTITANNSIKINEAELKNLTSNSATANIVNMVVAEDTNITTTDKTTLANATVNGSFTNNSKDTEVTGKLTVAADTLINAIDNVVIADADINGDLNINTKNTIIREILLSGNINSQTDSLDINTSNYLNIGYIGGMTNDYVASIKINSGESILNGQNDTTQYNMYVQNLELTADNSIGTTDKPMNIKLAEGNNIQISSNHMALNTTGADANYSKLDADTISLKTDKSINIDTLNANNAQISTTANNISILKMIINKMADIYNANKHVVVDNTSIKPIINADVQMYLSKVPALLIIDGSNNVMADTVNVTRQNEHIAINNDMKYKSMNSAVTSSAEAALKNTNVGEKIIERTETLIYKLPTQNAYNDFVKAPAQNVIKNQIDEVVTPQNAYDVVNITKKIKTKYTDKVSKNI